MRAIVTRTLVEVVAVSVLVILMIISAESKSRRHRKKFSKERERHAFLNHVLSDANYDGRLRPHLSTGKPTNVTVELMLISFGEFDEASMDFGVDLILRQYWNDPRLAFSNLNPNLTTAITLGDKVLHDMWVPDLFFANEKRAWRHDITTPNVLVRISPSGDILYSQRIKLTLACLYDFVKFPMDNQTCKIEMRSYAYTIEELQFIWSVDPIQHSNDLYMPEFTLKRGTPKYCRSKTITGEFTCIFAEFGFSRDIQFYLLDIYIPTIVVVIISFINFWIDPRATPARVSIGVITVLTISTQGVNMQHRLPRVSYIKAVDVWLATCLIFVVSSMLEYAVANMLLQRKARQKEKASRPEPNSNIVKAFQSRACMKYVTGVPAALPGVAEIIPLAAHRHDAEMPNFDLTPLDSKWNADNLDRGSRVIFISVFVIFNIIYWCIYLLY